MCYSKTGHLEKQYIKLKEFEKWHGQEVPSDLQLKQFIKPSCERYSCSLYLEGKNILISPKRHGEQFERTGLAKFPLSPQFITLSSYSVLVYLSTIFYSSSNLT